MLGFWKQWMIIFGVLWVGDYCRAQAGASPGIRVRVTRTGLQYGANVATKVLRHQINRIRIPTLRGRKNLLVGRVDYEISDVKMKTFYPPRIEVSTEPFRWTTTSKWGLSRRGGAGKTF